MTQDPATAPEPREADLLMPWIATGRADLRAAGAIQSELGDAEFERLLSIAREEQAETIALDEAVAVPTARLSRCLFEQIDAEPARPPARFDLLALWRGWTGAVGRLSPAMMTACASLAVLVIAIQAGVLATRGGGTSADKGGYTTASGPRKSSLGEGSFALVAFAPGATAEQITAALGAIGATVADGPSGGLYTLRLSPKPLQGDALDAVLAKLRGNSAVVHFVAPSQR